MAQDNEWELSKENIKPLKSGRRMCQLNLALRQDNNNSEYKATIQEFEMQLRILEGEELLIKWFDYVCWVEQRCISSSQESLSLMKRCVKHFKNNLEFKNNEKYVRIWIKISELTDDPNEIFNYMFNQEIGTSSAIFYRTWAEHNELLGHKKKADEIFVLGINRNADPVDTLKKRHSEFEWRMMKQAASLPDEDDENEIIAEQTRTALTHLLPSTKSGKVPSQRVKGRTPFGAVGTNGNRKVSSSSVFEIFDDENPTTSTSLPIASGSAKIKSLPFDGKGKENEKKTEKMVHAKIKKKSVPIFEETSFEIFRDTEEEECSKVPLPVSITSRKPLNSITSLVAETNIDIIQDLEKDESDPKAVYMFPKNKIYMGDIEVSLEELKSQLPLYTMR